MRSMAATATSCSISIFRVRGRFGTLYAADTVSIFVLPPSFGELEGRLRKRGTETEEAIARRLQRAREEASAYPEYDYVIVNAEVAQSLRDLAAIVECRAAAGGALARRVRAMEDVVPTDCPGQLEELVKEVQSYNPGADASLIRRAYDYSARMHGEQKRKSGEPYVIHPLNVALIIAHLRLDVPSIVTGLLHDVVEDTVASPEEVRSLFGPEVARLVDGVTKVSKITFSEPRGKAGRELPQDGHRDGARYPRRADQARRPPAQYAHAESSAAATSRRRSRARRWRFTRRSRIGWAFTGSSPSSKTMPSAT